MTIYNLGNIKGEKGDKGDSITGPTGPVGVGINSIEQITYMKFKFCLTDGSEYIINYGDEPTFDGISVSSTNDILSYADGDSTVLSAQLTNGGQAVSVSGESVTFEVRKVSDDSLVETLTDTTDNTGLASVEYFGKGVGDLSIKCQCRSLTKIFSIQDYLKVGFNNWNGTFTTGTDTYNYIQITGSNVSPNITLPSNWEMSYKFKNTRTDEGGEGSGLWNIGTDTNNSVLIGHEGTTCRIRIYSRSGGNNIVRETENNVYSYQTWTDAKITYNNGTISITVRNKTISYALSSASIMQFYNSYPSMRIAEWKIKPL